ncbi:612_t:CDS:2 [Ambispora gerdemannii]|uniref:612_t:CDS:1 n=1 Tax=Ambispora gerdemannii TaxID=144530 RepID=A0A9N9C3J6_9GLOM|nr:612_t:CDS:2 [Ambispora gerdemannii]
MTNVLAFSQVKDFLRKCNLLEYYERLIAEGFDDLQSVCACSLVLKKRVKSVCVLVDNEGQGEVVNFVWLFEELLDVTESDLIAMDVKRGHRRRLQREIATVKGVHPNLPLYIPPGPAFEEVSITNSTAPPPPIPMQVQTTPTSISSTNDNSILQNKYANLNTQTNNHHGPPLPSLSSRDRHQYATKEDDPPDNNRDLQDNGNPKRKYKRHPKRDKNAPVKPLSAYVMFAHRVREEYQGQNISFPDMAKIVGERWKTIPISEKEAIEADAAKAKEKYRAELEVYKTTDQWKQYQEYLKDFKAKYETSPFRGDLINKQRKRSKLEPLPEPDNISHSGYSSARSTSLGYQSSGSSNSNGEHNLHSHHGTPPMNVGGGAPPRLNTFNSAGSNYDAPFHHNSNGFDDSGVSTDNSSATTSTNNTPPAASIENEDMNNNVNNSTQLKQQQQQLTSLQQQSIQQPLQMPQQQKQQDSSTIVR